MSIRERNPEIYIQGFSRRLTKDDLKGSFRKYGKIREIRMKNGYAFIEYDNYHDAEEAVYRKHRKYLGDHKISVEPARMDRRRGDRSKPQKDDECWKCGKKGHWRNEYQDHFQENPGQDPVLQDIEKIPIEIGIEMTNMINLNNRKDNLDLGPNQDPILGHVLVAAL